MVLSYVRQRTARPGAERQPRPVPKDEGASYNNSHNGESLLRERTTNQGGSGRMSN